jgi:hypothetical protein
VKVPMILWVGSRVQEINAERCVVKVLFGWRTKNHFDCLYIGAYAVGADVAGGLLAMQVARGQNVGLIFKDLQADFIARGESDVVFTCEEGVAIKAAVDHAGATGERVNLPVKIVATAPATRGDQPVARLTLTLSLKRLAAK